MESPKRNLSDEALTKAIDALLKKAYKRTEPGAAVLVARKGRGIFRKAYGMADLELGVPMQPNMVFRLGSITKQFTAVAILMLAEQGKLALSDEITVFLPDYPTHGHKITIEHLLTHTSGIKSYTDMPEWFPLWRKDLTVQELIDMFKNQPMDFAPGERWKYSNSGYILLGTIIEKASGKPYPQFVQEHIFKPLGMKHSGYDDSARIIPRRVHGYSKGTDSYINAPYLSMTQPYAAGALISSVDDLAIWDKSLYINKLLRPETLQRAFQPYRLADGQSTAYGYGWAITSYEGHTFVEHGGGINGFLGHALRIPQERIFVAILTNRDSPLPMPDTLALKIAALMIGQPYREPRAIALDPNMFDAYVGVYQVSDKPEWMISREGDKLFAQPSGGSRAEIRSISPAEFFVVSDSVTRLKFVRDAAGIVIAVEARRRWGRVKTFAKADKLLPMARQAIMLGPALYSRYVGKYELAPGVHLIISQEGNQLAAQVPGQDKVEIFPESETLFFARAVDAQLEFLFESGGVVGLVLHQGKRELPAKKVK